MDKKKYIIFGAIYLVSLLLICNIISNVDHLLDSKLSMFNSWEYLRENYQERVKLIDDIILANKNNFPQKNTIISEINNISRSDKYYALFFDDEENVKEYLDLQENIKDHIDLLFSEILKEYDYKEDKKFVELLHEWVKINERSNVYKEMYYKDLNNFYKLLRKKRSIYYIEKIFSPEPNVWSVGRLRHELYLNKYIKENKK